uniref:uncharacterized protein At4g15970-like n=1 Tax=Erigeron canadensis TaxID=72917 RepID=UPI001CB98E5B|nr:uncharacterized protein At4g15970-like [Erigeron canadensis]
MVTGLQKGINHGNNNDNDLDELKGILNQATLGNNTVIITNVNDAWAKPHSTFDLFLESFRSGNQTRRFLKHLVVLAWDQKAYVRCLELHLHCYIIKTHDGMDYSSEAHFMAPDYLNIVWRKIDFLRMILELGYSFVFTDTDIMWFRDPFMHFHKDVDIQIACDTYNGNPFDLKNLPNSGFKYVKSNKKTIEFYKFWYNSRMAYPGLHDQDVFNMIKFNQTIKDIGLEIRFLDTAYFGGFCEPSNDLNKVCTMHANCCFGLKNMVHDLGVMLSDWQKYIKLLTNKTTMDECKTCWTTAQRCRYMFFHLFG